VSSVASTPGEMDVDAAIALARQRGVDRLEAQRLLAHLLGKDRTWLLAHGEATLATGVTLAFEQGLSRRLDGDPIAYIIGTQEFHGLSLEVDPRVLVPRPDTEVLVDWGLQLLQGEFGALHEPRVADLGTGSGAIAIAIAAAVGRRHTRARVWATDVSEEALTVARGNARRHAPSIRFAQGSWWSPLKGLRFDLVVSNPPYIAGGDVHLPALRSEPHGALTPGPTGLEALDDIISGASSHLARGGWLLLEHGFDQATAVQRSLASHGFRQVSSRTDLAGHQRCTGGHL
jgi:release factor glutamine methyltransferase